MRSCRDVITGIYTRLTNVKCHKDEPAESENLSVLLVLENLPGEFVMNKFHQCFCTNVFQRVSVTWVKLKQKGFPVRFVG